jgi:transposase-like protein
MQKTISPNQFLGDTFSRLWRSLIRDPNEDYHPPPPTIEFKFTKTQIKAKKEKPVFVATEPLPPTPTPTNIVEKITLAGVQKYKVTETNTVFTDERVGEKSPLVTEAEIKKVLEKYPSIDKNAVVICKRGWAKNMSNLLIVAELKKQDLKYGETYIKYMKSVFNESREVASV